jgi:hypothetical protein
MSSPQAEPGQTDRLSTNYGLWIATPPLVLLVILTLVWPERRSPLLVGAAAIAWLPVVLDALVIPRFRVGIRDLPSLEIPGTAYFIALGLVSSGTFALGFDPTNVDPAKAPVVRVALPVIATIAGVAALWCASSTRARRRDIARLLSSEATTGTLDGPPVLCIYGNEYVRYGSSVRESPLRKSENQARVQSPFDRRTLDLATTSWLSTVQHHSRVDNTTVSGPALLDGQSVLVCGGMGGPALLFAASANTDVRAQARRLQRRERVALGFAMFGVGLLVAAIIELL